MKDSYYDPAYQIQMQRAMNGIPLGFTMDENGNVSSYKAADGYVRIYEYDKNNKVIRTLHEDGYSSWFTRDEDGNLLSWENSLGMKTSWLVDYSKEKVA